MNDGASDGSLGCDAKVYAILDARVVVTSQVNCVINAACQQW